MKKRTHAIKDLQSGINYEIREHKSTFIVFSILRILVIGILVRLLFTKSWESAFMCGLTLMMFYIPGFVKAQFKIDLPPTLEIIVLFFIFSAEILGELASFYILIPCWDSLLHTLNGFLAAAIGYSLIFLLNNQKDIEFRVSPVYMAITAFCFSMTIGVVWEFFECGMDLFFGYDMQKDTVIHYIASVSLNPEGTNHVKVLKNISETLVNGKKLPIDGYLDIGLLDTMHDLFVNLIGATVFSVFGYFYAKHDKRGRFAENFVPSKKQP